LGSTSGGRVGSGIKWAFKEWSEIDFSITNRINGNQER